jgi:hypothetical protein
MRKEQKMSETTKAGGGDRLIAILSKADSLGIPKSPAT